MFSNGFGKVEGVFSIPDPNVAPGNPRFRTGERVFRLTSSATNITTQNQKLLHKKLILQEVFLEMFKKELLQQEMQGLKYEMFLNRECYENRL